MIDLSNYPHLSVAGKQAVREMAYQIDQNDNLTAAEKAWFAAMVMLMCDSYKSYEEAVSAASMQGLRRPQFLGDEMGIPADDELDASA